MNVVEHRPPLKRIEIGPVIEADRRHDISEGTSSTGPTERDRIWRLVEQTATGVNPPTTEELVKQYLSGGV